MTIEKKETGTFENVADKTVMEQIDAARKLGSDAAADVFGDHDFEDVPVVAAAAPPPAAEIPPLTAAEAPQAPVVDPAALAAAPAPTPAAPKIEVPPLPGETAAPAVVAEAAVPAPPIAEVGASQPVATPAPAPTQYRVPDPAVLAKTKTDLLTEKNAAFKKYSDGEMTPEDFAVIDNKVLLGLLEVGRNEALMQANEQNASVTQGQALASLQTHAAREGLIDYTKDDKAIDQFNAALEGLVKDPDAMKMPIGEFYREAHKIVLARRGLTPGATAAAAPTPAAPVVPATPPVVVAAEAPGRVPPAAPITLRELPTAATPNANGGREEQLARLASTDPQAFQQTIGAMPREQRNAWMDS